MGFVQEDTGNVSTKRWVLIWAGLGMIYALTALRFLIASDLVMFGIMAVLIPVVGPKVRSLELFGHPKRCGFVLNVGPTALSFQQLLNLWLHNRIYPFRNNVIKTHLSRRITESSLWKTKDEKKIRILDFGCGQGDTSWMLREIFGQDVDITSVDVYTAPRWVGGPSKRVTYDGNVLPFDDKHFDFAIAGEKIIYLINIYLY
jgi:hypothetical protein